MSRAPLPPDEKMIAAWVASIPANGSHTWGENGSAPSWYEGAHDPSVANGEIEVVAAEGT